MFSRRSPATSPRHLSPNPASSPSHPRSRSASLPSSSSYAYSSSPSRPVQSEEALRTVKVLEGAMVAWNEYRLAVSQQGRAARRLAGAMRELATRTDREGVAHNAVKPTAQTLDTISDLTIAYSKRLESSYDQANSESSRYFQNLAREVRDHETYLSNEGKRAMKSEKAYRKASKVMTEGAIQGSGLEAMKDALKLEVETTSEHHANLLGDAQAAIIFKVSAGLAGIIQPTVTYHSEGLKVAAERLGEIEYFRALSAAQWQDLSRPEVYSSPAEVLPHTDEPYSDSAVLAQSDTTKREKAEPISDIRLAYLPTPAKSPQSSLPIRPTLPSPHTSTPTSSSYTTAQNSPPVMRKLNSLPPPPMYASSSSLVTLRQLSTPPSTTSSIIPPQSNTQPLRIPDRTPRRRVSDIVAQHESSFSEPSPSVRRVSMPPQSLTTPSGPRPRPVRTTTALATAFTSTPIPNPTSPLPSGTDNPGLGSTTSSRQSSSNHDSALLSPSTVSTSSVTVDPDSGTVLKSAMRKRPVSFGSVGSGEGLGSFPWGMSVGGHEEWTGVASKGKGGGVGVRVLQPSPRRVSSLSPELRDMMSG